MDDAAFVAYLRNRNDELKDSDQPVTKLGLDEAASLLGVTQRQTRSRITRINASLRTVAQVSYVRPEGYRLFVFNTEALDAWIENEAQAPLAPQTPEERQLYLLVDLINRNGWVTLDTLSEELFVSKSTLSADIKAAEQRLAAYGLSIARRPHYGIRVEGEEVDKRRCLAYCCAEDAAVDQSVSSEEYAEHVAKVSTHIQRALDGIDIRISSAAMTNLVTHVAVAVSRIKEGYYVPMPFEELDHIQATNEYAAAKVIAGEIECHTGVVLPETEIAYIAIHLGGRRTYGADDTDSGALVISDEVWDVVGEVVDEVARLFRYDFHSDLELHMNLARHIVPLATRLKYGIRLNNPILSEIKGGYSLAYSMATVAASVIGTHYDAALAEDEVGYLALALALAIERKNSGPARKNVLVVCASGAGSARLLEYRCRREFGDFIGTIQACDVMNLDRVDFSEIDYVFSTVPIERALPVPVCFIRHMLDAGDIEHIRTTLQLNDTAKAYSYFDERLFVPHLVAKSKQEVIDALLKQVATVRDPGPRFAELVNKREETMPTALGNLVAMPHPIEPTCDETFVCVGMLDEAVLWNAETAQKAQLVLLFSFARGHDIELQGFFNAMAEFLMNEENVRAVLADQSWQTFMERLKPYGITER